MKVPSLGFSGATMPFGIFELALCKKIKIGFCTFIHWFYSFIAFLFIAFAA